MAVTTFTANSTISTTDAVDNNSSATDLHTPLSDASDSTYTHTIHASSDANCVLGLTDLPANATTATPVTAVAYDIRTRGFDPNNDDDTIHLDVQITSAAGTAYTNTVRVRSFTAGGGTTAFSDTTGSFTVNATGLAASETDWNGARLRFDWVYAKLKGGDGIDIDIAEASFDVTYNQVADALTADDLESAGELTRPAVGQVHAITADDLQSVSNATSPTAEDVALSVDLTADDLQSVSNLSTPAVGQEHALLADDLDSAGELTQPTVGQEHALTADDLDSVGQLSTPAVGQEHTLLADDLDSAGELTQPSVSETTALTADDLESAGELSTPAIGQEHAIAADDLQSASSVSTPTAAEDTQNELLADDLQSAGEVSQPVVTQTHALLADDLQSVGQLSTPDLGENIERLAPDADTSIGNWTDEGGGTTNIYQSIDEWPFADGDYIQSEVGPSASAYRASLTNPAATINTADTQTVRYRYGKSPGDSNQVDLTVRLIEGASTVIATWTHTDVSAVLSDASQPLSAGQKASITNHDNLSLEFEANAP